MAVSTMPPPQLRPPKHHRHRRRRSRRVLIVIGAIAGLLAIGGIGYIWLPGSDNRSLANQDRPPAGSHPSTAAPAPVAFNPNDGAILPDHRIVAYYAVPGVAKTGPAFEPTSGMLKRLKAQGAVYEKLDPKHPVQLGIDLVVSVPDRFKGERGTYSHQVDAATIDRYVDFCRANNLLLFLDLDIGWADPVTELMSFSRYLKLPFVQVAIDPEWMFPRQNGIPGKNLSNVRASDLNPLIQAVAELPEKYHVPRKVMLIHQYRPDGDGSANPFDAKTAEIADKRNLIDEARVDVVIHVDSVGGWPGDIALKESQYKRWVAGDMAKYENFRYGGFKIFYKQESRHKLMTPKQVMAMKPAPMVITYGN